MRRTLLTLVLLVLLAIPGTALAHDRDWEADFPKGMDDGIKCIASATVDGHSYRNVNWIGADADEMRKDANRERGWQADYCDRQGRETVFNYFHYSHGIDIDPSIVKIQVERLP